MTEKVVLPPMISILSPRPSGVLSRAPKGKPKGPDPQRHFRCPDSKYEPIEAAAKLLGMSAPEFCRWVAYTSANEVLRLAREQKVSVPIDPVVVPTEPPKPRQPQISTVVPTLVINPYKAT